MDITEIKVPEVKKGRGYPPVNAIQKMANPDKMDCLKGLYEKLSQRFQRYNKIHRNKEKLIEAIAIKYDVPSEALETVLLTVSSDIAFDSAFKMYVQL